MSGYKARAVRADMIHNCLLRGDMGKWVLDWSKGDSDQCWWELTQLWQSEKVKLSLTSTHSRHNREVHTEGPTTLVDGWNCGPTDNHYGSAMRLGKIVDLGTIYMNYRLAMRDR